MKGSEDQAVDVPFSGGMGEGVAPFTLNVPFVELAEDCVITKEGAYQRIPGGSSPADVTGVTGGTRGLSVFDSTLVQHTTSGPQQYNETANTWRASNPKGFVPTQAKSDLVVAQSGKSVYNTQIASTLLGYELYLWDETYPQLENNAYSTYGVGFVAKGLALRDPSGGWLIPPTSTALGTCPGHQIIAVNTTFLIAFATTSGFQVYSLPQAATSLSSLSHIVVNATGSAIALSASSTMTSVQDCCLATNGAAAYFLVGQYSGSVNYYVYTVDATGQIGSASNGAWVGFSSGAICVDNAKVYVARTESGGANVYLSNFSESLITTGIPSTVIGSFTTASGNSGYRVRLSGKANQGIYCALESYVAAPSTTAVFAAYPPATTPSYKQLPNAPYVEVGFLPTADLIAGYSATANRAYAHGYTLKSGLGRSDNSRVQFLVAYNGLSQLARAYVGGNMQSQDGFTTANFGIWDQVEASGPYYGGVWLEILSATVATAQGTVTNLSFRSLARVCWDSLYSDHRIDTSPAVGVYNKREAICYIRGSLSRAVDLKIAAESILDAETHGLRRVQINTTPKPPLSVVSHGDLFFDGSCQHVWDGQHSFENTPHFPPVVAWVPELPTGDPGDSDYIEAPPVSITSSAYGYTDTYSFYWEWVDGSGYLHRSGVTSLYLRVTGPLTEGGCYHYTFSIPGYFAVLPPLSANDSAAFRNLRLVVAMLPGTGTTTRTTLYSKWARTWESTVAAFVDMRVSDRGESTPTTGYIYTDGGVLEAQASPSPVSITSTRDRLWLISADNRRQLYYSKPLEQLIAPEFNSALTVDIPADAGEGVVVLTVDDKPAVLCERGLYVIAGDGPNALGLQGDFTPQVVQSDTGCKDKNSTTKCDYGAFFQGERGIYLLDRGLNVSLVSQGVQDKAQGDISKAIAVPKEQQVRFGLTYGGILVYHYALKAWTYLDKTAYDAVVWDDAYTRVYAPGAYKIAASDGSSPVDPEGINDMRIKTCWIKADKMQGFSRFKRVLLLHSQRNSYPTDYGPITVDIYFNYEDDDGEGGSYVESSTISSANRKPANQRSQVDIRIGRQKVESIKLDIRCPNRFSQGDTVEFYEPIAMEGVCLVVGTITNTQFRHLRKQTKS